MNFPDSFSFYEQTQADHTCAENEDFALLRTEYRNLGYLTEKVLLDGVQGISYAIPTEDCERPLEQRRISWRITWEGATGVDATTVVTTGLHTHVVPEGDAQ